MRIIEFLYHIFGVIKNVNKIIKELFSPKIILMVDGGIGSQLNKFVIGRCIENATKIKVYYDISWFEKCGMDITGKNSRYFDLPKLVHSDLFPVATPEDILFYKKYFYKAQPLQNEIFVFHDDLLCFKFPKYVDGYYFHWRYYRLVENDLRKMISFEKVMDEKSKLLIDDMQQQVSVAVHIRLGDYVGSAYDVLTEEYYKQAIAFVQKSIHPLDPIFYLFSNDINQVKEKIIPVLDSTQMYVPVESNDNDSGYMDLLLMTKCKHQIIANSSMSYVAAFLNDNKNKIIIAPKQWMKDVDKKDNVCPPEWVLL